MIREEKIGNVAIDYKFYSGEDLYSDGAIEDELLYAVKSHKEEEFNTIIDKKNDWAFLYHLSQIRKNIVSWIPFKGNEKVLEIGSGCGAITGALAEKAKTVDCVELSKKRSLINANRNKEHKGINIKVGNFEEIEPYLDQDYDVITLIGVWEYAGIYLTSKNPFHDFLNRLRKHLKKNGKIVIAIENRFGLKYWAGCREDHTNLFFEGLEGYTHTSSAITFGKNELERLFNDTGYQSEFYYPYPDYKLPLNIFSDDYLPKKGSLNDNSKNLDRSRVTLFDEGKVFDSIIQDDMFPYFSNSFLIMLKVKEDSDNVEDKVVYSKYSNERSPEFRIRTDIIKSENNELKVKKYPMDKKAVEHITKLKENYDNLITVTKDLPVQFNACYLDDTGCVFEYIDGNNVEEELKDLFCQGRTDEARVIIDRWVKIVQGMATLKFVQTKEFCDVFGECPLADIEAIEKADIDLIFSNIIRKNNIWNIIDYEWSFDFPIPVNYILYRILKRQTIKEIRDLNLCDYYGISEQEQEVYERMEINFLRYVYRGHTLLADSKIIKPKYNLKQNVVEESSVKVYYDYGEGLKEENVEYYFYNSSENIIMDIPLQKNIVGIRIDPMESSGIVKLKQIICKDEEKEYIPSMQINGYPIQERYYLFDTRDPWIYIPELNKLTKYLHLELGIEKISSEVVEECLKQHSGYKKLKLKEKLHIK